MSQTTKIAVNKLTRLVYASQTAEQEAFARVIAYHEPIARLLAMQPPGTLLVCQEAVFCLVRQPGESSFTLVESYTDDEFDRAENGMTLDMIDGLGASDLAEIANFLQAMLDEPVYKDGGNIVLPIWMDVPAQIVASPEQETFEVQAHTAFSSLPMSECDPRTMVLGPEWEKIGCGCWISKEEPNAPAVFLEVKNSSNVELWRVSVRRGGRLMLDLFPEVKSESFALAVPVALEYKNKLHAGIHA